MRMVRSILWTICFAACVGALSCNDDEKDPCELYCETMTDCYRMLDQPFSASSCRRDCYDNFERYGSVGCKNRYLDLVECKTDLSCTDANNVSEDCAPETEDLIQCIED